jgi:pyridoxamine 5'-phosphate oxidase
LVARGTAALAVDNDLGLLQEGSVSPIDRFREAFARATASEPDVPDAAVLATADAEGRPSARVVLLRSVDERGFGFFTNYRSRKARELDARPYAALCVHWKTLAEQVRIEGRVARSDLELSDAYFAGRPRESQLAALASRQSETLASRELLERCFAELSAKHEGSAVPRPEFWGGYLLVPDRIEFWRQGDHRLHHRELYERDVAGGWSQRLLYP